MVRCPALAPAKRASTTPSWQWLMSYYRRQLPQAGFPNPRVGVAAWGPAALGLSFPLMAAVYAIDSADGLRGPRFSAAAGP